MSSRGMFYPKDQIPTREEEMANAREELIFNLTEDLLLIMEDAGVSKVKLAEHLGKTRAYCTQLLNGTRNMTLNTFSDVCFALKVKPEIKLTSQKAWRESPVIKLPSQKLKPLISREVGRGNQGKIRQWKQAA